MDDPHSPNRGRVRSAAPRAPGAAPLVALGAALALILAACSGPSGTNGGDGPRVAVTTSILGDVVDSVATPCGARVDTIMGAGADPHSFLPSARQVDTLRRSDLVVANGGGLEEGLLDVVAAARADGTPVLDALDTFTPLTFAEDAAGGGEAGHEHGATDPHFWQDPTRMAAFTRALGERLAALAPDEAQCARRSARGYAARLESLDTEIRGLLADIPADRRVLVTNHEAFGYFAEHYGFDVVGVVIPGGSTLAAPSAADLADLAATVRASGAPAVFVENTAPDRLARALAREVGRDVVVAELFSGALGPPGSAAATYPGMLRANAHTIAEALAASG